MLYHMDTEAADRATRFQEAVRGELRAEKAARGISRWEDVANAAGISSRSLQRYVADRGERRDIPIPTLDLICSALGTDIVTITRRAEARLTEDRRHRSSE